MAGKIDHGHHHQDRQDRTGSDDAGIADADDVAETEIHSCGVEPNLEPQICHALPEGAEQHFRIEVVVPQMEKLDDEVVEEPETKGHQKNLAGRSLRLLAGRQHVGDRRAFGERELAVKVFDEVPPKWDQKDDTEVSADEAGEEDLQERRLEVEDVECWDSEDCTGDDDAGGLTDGLDNHVFEQAVAAGEQSPEKDREDRDRDRCFDDISGLESDVGGGEGENHHHDDTDDYGTRRGLWARVVGGDDRGIGFTWFELTECVLRQDLGGLGRRFHQYPPGVSILDVRSLSGQQNRIRNSEFGIRNYHLHSQRNCRGDGWPCTLHPGSCIGRLVSDSVEFDHCVADTDRDIEAIASVARPRGGVADESSTLDFLAANRDARAADATSRFGGGIDCGGCTDHRIADTEIDGDITLGGLDIDVADTRIELDPSRSGPNDDITDAVLELDRQPRGHFDDPLLFEPSVIVVGRTDAQLEALVFDGNLQRCCLDISLRLTLGGENSAAPRR